LRNNRKQINCLRTKQNQRKQIDEQKRGEDLWTQYEQGSRKYLQKQQSREKNKKSQEIEWRDYTGAAREKEAKKRFVQQRAIHSRNKSIKRANHEGRRGTVHRPTKSKGEANQQKKR